MSKIIGITTATPYAISKLNEQINELNSKIDESLLYEKELYVIQPYWDKMGVSEKSKGYYIYDSTELDLKAGEKYIVSIIAPQIGEYASIESFTDGLNYKEDRYTGVVVANRNISTLNGFIADFGLYSPENEISSSAKIVIAKETLMNVTERFGDIESALDGIITLQENLIGGDTV